MERKNLLSIIPIIISFIIGKFIGKDFLNLTKKVEKIVVLDINKIMIIGVMIFIGYIILMFIYEESETSQNEIRKIFKNIYYGSFILVVYTLGSEDLNVVYKYINFNLLLIFIGSLFHFLLDNLKGNEKEVEKEELELYESRKKYSKNIKRYLESMKAFSITGDWGIGKTVLLNNFFKDKCSEYKYNYKLIYLDVSIYSKNEKIIKSIEEQLNSIFSKYNILKFRDDLFRGISDLNNWCRFFSSFINTQYFREDLKLIKKIEEVKQKQNKDIVIALDNFERISDKNRIIQLLSIIEERIPEKIKRIYLYDEKYMEKLFKGNFNNYSKKYIEGKIEVTEITKEDILNFNKDFGENILKLDEKLEERKTKLEEYLRIYKINNKEENTKVLEVEKLKDSVKENIKNIKDKLKNPRYLEQLNKKFIIFSKEEDSSYKLELQIIKDIFSRIELKKLQKNYYKELSTLLNEKIDLASVIFIFFEVTENQGDRLKVYLGKKFSDAENQLKEIEDNVSGRLTEGLGLISRTFDNNKKPKIYKEFLEKVLEKEYVIKSYLELGELLYFKDYSLLGDYSSLGNKSLFSKIKIAKIENDEGIFLKKSFENEELKKYFLFNDSIREIVYFILGDINEMYEYEKLILVTFDEFMEKTLGTSELKKLSDKIKIEINENIGNINRIKGLKEKVEKEVSLIETFLNLEEADVEISGKEFESLGAKNSLTWINNVDKIKNSYNKMKSLDEKELKIDLGKIVSSDGSIRHEEVIINSENIRRGINHMQKIIGASDNSEMEYNKSSFLIFLINLEKEWNK